MQILITAIQPCVGSEIFVSTTRVSPSHLPTASPSHFLFCSEPWSEFNLIISIMNHLEENHDVVLGLNNSFKLLYSPGMLRPALKPRRHRSASAKLSGRQMDRTPFLARMPFHRSCMRRIEILGYFPHTPWGHCRTPAIWWVINIEVLNLPSTEDSPEPGSTQKELYPPTAPAPNALFPSPPFTGAPRFGSLMTFSSV